jgi:hypothetical protein
MKNSQYNKSKGAQSEARFETLFTNHIVRKATREEDMNLHFDYIIKTKNGQELKVDVKSAGIRVETVRRWLSNLPWHNQNNPDTPFPESKKLGWLYGSADYIAYEVGTTGAFQFIKREYLVSFLADNPSIRRYAYQEGSEVVYISQDLLDPAQIILQSR